MLSFLLKYTVSLGFVLWLTGCATGSASSRESTDPIPDTVSGRATLPTTTENAIQMGLNAWRDAGYSGKNVIVSLLDTGMPVASISDRNILYSENLRYVADYGTDTLNKVDDDSLDNANHGNDMSQVIGSSIYGAAPDAWILNGVIADSAGKATRSSIMMGVDWSLKHSADIVNLSFSYGALDTYTGGFYSNIENTFTAIKNRVAGSDLAIVHSAGNQTKSVSALISNDASWQDWVKTSAKNHILIVGATGDNKTLASFSNFAGSDQDVKDRFILAPAKSEVDTGYTVGTSGAAANVSGALALLKQRWTTLTGPQAEKILLDTADRSFGAYDPFYYGQGVLDMDAAFHPVGSTTVPVLDTQSYSVSALHVSLPYGFKSIQTQTAVLDSYGRDFTMNYEISANAYHGRIDALVDSLSAKIDQKPAIDAMQKPYALTFIDASELKAPSGSLLTVFDPANRLLETLNSSIGGAFKWAGSLAVAQYSAEISVPNNAMKYSEPQMQWAKLAVNFDEMSLMPYYLRTGEQARFYGAETETTMGLISSYTHQFLTFTGSFGRHTVPGNAVIRRYEIDSATGSIEMSHRIQDMRVGAMVYTAYDEANIHVASSKSLGDGTLIYGVDTLHSNRWYQGISLESSYHGLTAAMHVNPFDTEWLLGYHARW